MDRYFWRKWLLLGYVYHKDINNKLRSCARYELGNIKWN